MQLPETARALLRAKAWGHVVTRNANGSPQVTMVWVDEEDGDLVFNTNMERRKAINLQRDPRITVSVQNIASPQEYLLVRGRAELQTEGAYDHINRLAHRFTGGDYPKNEGEVRVKVRVKADRVGGAGPWA